MDGVGELGGVCEGCSCISGDGRGHDLWNGGDCTTGGGGGGETIRVELIGIILYSIGGGCPPN